MEESQALSREISRSSDARMRNSLNPLRIGGVFSPTAISQDTQEGMAWDNDIIPDAKGEVSLVTRRLFSWVISKSGIFKH